MTRLLRPRNGRRALRLGVGIAVASAVAALSTGVAVASFTDTTSGATDLATRDLLAPSGLTVTGSCSAILAVASLSWTAGSSWADGQEVWRSTTAGAAGLLVGTKAATDTKHEDSPLTSGVTYYFRVESVKGSWREASAEVAHTAAAC